MPSFVREPLKNWLKEAHEANVRLLLEQRPDLTHEQAEAIVTEREGRPIGPYHDGITMLSPLPGPDGRL